MAAASRYKTWYTHVVRPELVHALQLKNLHAAPTLTRATLSSSTTMQPSGLDNPFPSALVLEMLTGKPYKFTRVTKPNHQYNARVNSIAGAKASLEGEPMWHFVDRLVTQVLPRVTDFEGLSPTAFNQTGRYVDYMIGLTDWTPLLESEAQQEVLRKVGGGLRGMPGLGICLHTTATSTEHARMLLAALRMPFRAKK